MGDRSGLLVGKRKSSEAILIGGDFLLFDISRLKELFLKILFFLFSKNVSRAGRVQLHRLNGGEATVRRSADLGKLTSSTELSCNASGSEPSVRGNGGFDTDAAPSPHPRASSAQMGGGPAQIHFTIWRNTLCNFNKYNGGFETAAPTRSPSLIRWIEEAPPY